VNSPPPSLADAVCCPHGQAASGRTGMLKKYIYIYIFLVVVAGLKREKKKVRFSVSIPKIPELRGLCRQSHKKKKVFSA
jgi:hypothetical protein